MNEGTVYGFLDELEKISLATGPIQAPAPPQMQQPQQPRKKRSFAKKLLMAAAAVPIGIMGGKAILKRMGGSAAKGVTMPGWMRQAMRHEGYRV
jgi:hypothetical protein